MDSPPDVDQQLFDAQKDLLSRRQEWESAWGLDQDTMGKITQGMSDSELLKRAENLVPALQTAPDQVFTPMAKAIAEELSARGSTTNLPITQQLMNLLPGS